MSTFDASQLIQELEAGQLNAKLTAIIKEVVLGVVDHGKSGKVSLDMDFKRVGESLQISTKSKVSWKRPTKKGATEGHEGEVSTLYSNKKGELSIMPLNQTEIFSTKEKA